MNQKSHLILNNGKDITADVMFCKYNQGTRKYDVTFQSEKVYSYNYTSIEWIREPKAINPALVRIIHREQDLFKVQEIYVFHAEADDYWHICFSNNSARTYPKRELKITQSCLSETESNNCINYLRQIATINELKSDEGELLLQKQYDNLNFVGEDTAMAVYLNPASHKICTRNIRNLIFPFGGNASQFQAVRQALSNQISVIQGPPGTGKTQTILNIIANLLADGKSVQVVSNNNSATTVMCQPRRYLSGIERTLYHTCCTKTAPASLFSTNTHTPIFFSLENGSKNTQIKECSISDYTHKQYL